MDDKIKLSDLIDRSSGLGADSLTEEELKKLKAQPLDLKSKLIDKPGTNPQLVENINESDIDPLFLETNDPEVSLEEVQDKIVKKPSSASVSPTASTSVSGTTKKSTKDQPKGVGDLGLPESKEAKLIEDRLTQLNLQYAKLTDPPMTSADVRKDMADDLKRVRENKETTYMWAQLAERFLAAATKFGAAKEGLARNLDMSNAEIERTDWDKLTERAYTRYKDGVQDLVDKIEKEDKAKAQVDALRVRQDELRTSLTQNLARLEDARASELRRLEEGRQDRAAKALQNQLNRDTQLKAASLKQQPKDSSLSPQFLAQRKAAEENIRSLIGQEASRTTIKNAIEQDRRYLSPEFRSSLVELGMGRGPDFMIKQTEQSTTETGPEPGTIKGGYRFLGGNPADPSSWEKI